MAESIFSKIIKGDIPSHKVYEDDKTYAFMDINPVSHGHTLVISKAEVEFVWDLPEDDYVALIKTVKKVALKLRKELNVPYVGEMIIGTDVPHAHIHLIPFKTFEEFRNLPDLSKNPDHDKLSKLAEKLRIEED